MKIIAPLFRLHRAFNLASQASKKKRTSLICTITFGKHPRIKLKRRQRNGIARQGLVGACAYRQALAEEELFEIDAHNSLCRQTQLREALRAF